ncbi:hypothetical protein C8R44DRAFT_738624 [Mycena epipterygia]|nr:hypothetical protein C8R44DRAFT_738624 [Mycena epipterygia]
MGEAGPGVRRLWKLEHRHPEYRTYCPPLPTQVPTVGGRFLVVFVDQEAASVNEPITETLEGQPPAAFTIARMMAAADIGVVVELIEQGSEIFAFDARGESEWKRCFARQSRCVRRRRREEQRMFGVFAGGSAVPADGASRGGENCGENCGEVQVGWRRDAGTAEPRRKGHRAVRNETQSNPSVARKNRDGRPATLGELDFERGANIDDREAQVESSERRHDAAQCVHPLSFFLPPRLTAGLRGPSAPAHVRIRVRPPRRISRSAPSTSSLHYIHALDDTKHTATSVPHSADSRVGLFNGSLRDEERGRVCTSSCARRVCGPVFVDSCENTRGAARASGSTPSARWV